MDTNYLSSGTSTYQNAMNYCLDPVPKFREYANSMKDKEIIEHI